MTAKYKPGSSDKTKDLTVYRRISASALVTFAAAMERILATAREGPHRDYFEPIFLAWHSGLRRNELLGLKWGGADLTLCTVSVNRSVYQAKKGTSLELPPKTQKGRRLVSLTPSSALVLRALRERHQADGHGVSGDG